MMRGRKPRLRLHRLAALLLLSACAGLPLAHTPYRVIRNDDPRKKVYRVRVEVAVVEDRFDHVISPRKPPDAQVRKAVCAGLAGSQFRCVSPGEASAAVDYEIRLAYDVVENPGVRRMERLASGGLARGRFGEHDPAQDTDHQLQWQLSVFRPGAREPFFRSEAIREGIDFWEGNLSHSVRRYFTE